MNPIRDLLDAVAYAGTRPPAADLDQVVADVTREDLGDSGVTTASLRRELLAHIDDMVAACADGNSGHARHIGREATASICDRLPDYRPSVPDRTAEDIVASIPRGIG